MGVNYSRTGKRSGRNTGDMIAPGMTTITCPNCQRVLGRVYSTNGAVICDKCGSRSYTRIYGKVMVTMPFEYLQYEGYYEKTDKYIHEMKTLINSEQIEIENQYDEVKTAADG